MAFWAGVALAVAAVGVSAYSAKEQKDATKDAARRSERLAKESNDITNAGNTIEQRREVRQAMRENRIRRAQILQASENAGVGDSSAVANSVASVDTVTGSNIAEGSSRISVTNALGNNQVAQARSNARYNIDMGGAKSLATIGQGLGMASSLAFQYGGQPAKPTPTGFSATTPPGFSQPVFEQNRWGGF